MNQHQEYVAYVFKQAFAKGLVKNRTEFARELNVAPSTISHIINGDKKWVGKTVERNAKLWADAHGIEPDEAETEREKAEMKKLKVDLASGFIRAMLPKEGIYPDPEEIVGMAVLYAEELLKQVN